MEDCNIVGTWFYKFLKIRHTIKMLLQTWLHHHGAHLYPSLPPNPFQKVFFKTRVLGPLSNSSHLDSFLDNFPNYSAPASKFQFPIHCVLNSFVFFLIQHNSTAPNKQLTKSSWCFRAVKTQPVSHDIFLDWEPGHNYVRNSKNFSFSLVLKWIWYRNKCFCSSY